MPARSAVLVLVLLAQPASAEPSVGVAPYVEPMIFMFWDLDYRTSGTRTQLAAGAELFRSADGAKELAGRLGLTLGHHDIGGGDHKSVGIELGGSLPLGRFGRLGPNASLSMGTRDLGSVSTAGMRYQYRFMTAGVEVGWAKHENGGHEYHQRNLFVSVGFTGKPGIANLTGVVLLGLAELVFSSFPRT